MTILIASFLCFGLGLSGGVLAENFDPKGGSRVLGLGMALVVLSSVAAIVLLGRAS